jgi:hypothetical protein
MTKDKGQRTKDKGQRTKDRNPRTLSHRIRDRFAGGLAVEQLEGEF